MPDSTKPARTLNLIVDEINSDQSAASYCIGFELSNWRLEALANTLVEWIPDYALREDELVHKGNMYVKLREAAIRVYTSEKYKKRGEVGEISLHAICRDFWNTIPIAPRVFYLTASNEVVKSFDLVHMRIVEPNFEIWLGEAKFYTNPQAAIKDAIDSVRTHIDQGFLTQEKLLLGPQISKSIPHYERVVEVLSSHSSLDKLFETAVFPVCIMANSSAVKGHTNHCQAYADEVAQELCKLNEQVGKSGLRQKIRVLLIYIPLGSKDDLATLFDKKLKGLQA